MYIMKRVHGFVIVLIGKVESRMIREVLLVKHIDSSDFLIAELKDIGNHTTLEIADKKVIA